MNIRTICRSALLMVIGSMVAAQPVLAQSNPPCAGVSATGFVNWPQFHSDLCHTGYNPNEFLLSPATVGNLAFRLEVPDGGCRLTLRRRWPTAWCTSGPTNNNVYALNASTGALLWKYTTGWQVVSSPAVANGVVYVGSNDDNVYALNASTGALLWKYTTADRTSVFTGGGQWRGVRRVR